MSRFEVAISFKFGWEKCACSWGVGGSPGAPQRKNSSRNLRFPGKNLPSQTRRNLQAGAADLKAAPCRRPNEWAPMEKPPRPWLLVSLKEPMGTMGQDPQINENRHNSGSRPSPGMIPAANWGGGPLVN